MEEIIRYFPELTAHQQKQFQQLKALYSDWNSKINVISRKDMDDFYIKHVLHSLAIAKVITFQAGAKVLDVGTGGGFPALPLSIFFPDTQFTAVDSIGKKIKVVQAISEEIGLTNLTSMHKRAEEVQGTFDFVVSRAVTRTKRFLPWVKGKKSKKSNHSMANGFLFLKGGDLQEELAEVNGKFQHFAIADFFEEPFFETKKVIYLPF